LSAGTRRNGTSKTGPFRRTSPFPDRQRQYAARHAVSRPKTARWAGQAAPAAAIAATLAAGVATYAIAGGQPGTGTAAVALTLPVKIGSTAHASGRSGNADAAAARTAADRAAASATRRASASPSPSRPAPTATAQPTAAAQPTATAQSGQPTAAPAQPAATGAGPVSCSQTSSLLPGNVTAIVNFLLSNGYTRNAAAGIAGNIYQESKGDPESVGMGGGGLIGWTPLPSGFVTGDPAADLQTQLAAILTYDNGWSAYLPALNDAATPADAAYIYVTDFERAGIPAASTREASADAVAAACGL
jgi:Phage tail lysozyme